MSHWRADNESPADYKSLIYGEELSDEELQSEMNDTAVTGDDTMTSSGPESRERSRSPLLSPATIKVPASAVVLQIYDQHGLPLDAMTTDVQSMAPDTYDVSTREGERDEQNHTECNRRSISGRSRGRGVRGRSARGRGGYPKRGRIAGGRSLLAQPLQEIWQHDEDVPSEISSLVTGELRGRQKRMLGDAVVDRTERGSVDSESESESESEEEFVCASDGADALNGQERQNLEFEWYPMDTFQGREEIFQPSRTGSVRVHESAYDAFRSYWSDDIIGLIVAETNLYATKISSPSFQAEWVPTNIDEILCLFSFWMMLGIIRMPTIQSCFSADPLLSTEVFKRIFKLKRYESLNRALQFVDYNPVMDPSDISAKSFDRLHRLRPIITHLNSTFQSNYILSQNICIDESLSISKGIKTFELCESATGYLWSFIVYAGKKSATDLDMSDGALKSTAIVKKLMGPLLNKGHRLFMDNWYNSPLLARFLKLNGTDCVGTLRSYRRDVPLLINKAPLKRGEYIARHSGDVTVLSWQDKKRVTMISTCHDSSLALPTVSSRPLSRLVPFKPQVVLDYNKFIGGVDMKDQMLEPYLLARKRCKKWYINFFKRLLNVSILNSRILLQSSAQRNIDHLAFRLELVDSILSNHLSNCPKSRRFTVSSSRSTHEQPGRFISSDHWPILMGRTESTAARNRNYQKRCVVCLNNGIKNSKTSYCCESCRVPLCITDCFKAYHTSG